MLCSLRLAAKSNLEEVNSEAIEEWKTWDGWEFKLTRPVAEIGLRMSWKDQGNFDSYFVA